MCIFFIAVKMMIMMMRKKGGIRATKMPRALPSSRTPLSGEEGRSQLITGRGWGRGVRLESLLGLFAASLFH